MDLHTNKLMYLLTCTFWVFSLIIYMISKQNCQKQIIDLILLSINTCTFVQPFVFKTCMLSNAFLLHFYYLKIIQIKNGLSLKTYLSFFKGRGV